MQKKPQNIPNKSTYTSHVKSRSYVNDIRDIYVNAGRPRRWHNITIKIMRSTMRVVGRDCIWQTIIELAAHFPSQERKVGFSFHEKGSGGRRSEGKNTSTIVPPRSSFPRGWSSRRVASASNLTKLQCAISSRFADVTIRIALPVPSTFIYTRAAEVPEDYNN